MDDESGNGQSDYGRRENPRKTWRASDTNITSPHQETCKRCGKCFNSLRALRGHMASHLDTDNEKWVIPTISSKKGKKVVTKSGSAISEIDGNDQEDVAKLLVSMSRDNLFKCDEPSEDNSIIMETKCSSFGRKTKNVVDNQEQEVKNTERAEMEDSDSDYFLDESGSKSESGISIDGRQKSYDKHLMVMDPRGDQYKHDKSTKSDEKSHKKYKYGCSNCKKIFKSHQALGGHRPCHKSRDESEENSPDESSEIMKSEKQTKGEKNKSHVCPVCDRVFKSGQAMGGHKRSHFLRGNNSRTPEVKKKKTTKDNDSDLIDLNLPAHEQDEEDGNGQSSGR